MTGAALWNFLITCVGLVLVVALIFLAIVMIEAPEGFKKIARFAIGGIALLIFLVAVGGVLGFGGSGIAINPMNLIEFAIGLIVLLVVLFIAYRVIDYFGFMAVEIKYVVGAVALIVILILAKQALFGSGFGFIPGSGIGARHSMQGWHCNATAAAFDHQIEIMTDYHVPILYVLSLTAFVFAVMAYYHVG